MINLLVSFFLFLSGLFILLAAVGLKRFPDLYCRMHATSKASTIAKVFSFTAAAIHFYGTESITVQIKLVCVVIFFFITSPVGGHLIARAGYKRGASPSPLTWLDDYKR